MGLYGTLSRDILDLGSVIGALSSRQKSTLFSFTKKGSKVKKILATTAIGVILVLSNPILVSAGGKDKCRYKCVPEIDVFSGLAALATLGGVGALVMERRRRHSNEDT